MSKALVVISGGQDSATCAAWAKAVFDDVEFLSFDYGQRHKKELDAARKISWQFNGAHTILPVPSLAGGATSGLTNPDVNVNEVDERTGLPKSFVPGRNLVFLTSAAAFALSRGITDIVTGVCQTDYSGYPDCRRETIDALERAVRLGNANLLDRTDGFRIHTPLMYLTKAETVRLALRLPGGWQAVAASWTCYEGGDKPCGKCPACELRAKGFAETGLRDPAL